MSVCRSLLSVTLALVASTFPAQAQQPQFVPVPGLTPSAPAAPSDGQTGAGQAGAGQTKAGQTTATPPAAQGSDGAAPAAQAPVTPAQGPPPPLTPPRPVAPAKGKPAKPVYTGPTAVVVLPPTPMLDVEGRQIIDPDGKPMFNPPVQQMRDKKGHPVFDDKGKPVFQTASDLGYDEKGKKIPIKKTKPPKMTPVTVAGGTLTVDGWTGKARLNYDIADLKFIYIYAPGIGTAIVSNTPFTGAKEQPKAFDDKTLTITVDGHPMQLYSEKRLLGKQPASAWVAVDRNYLLPDAFPVFGYGVISRAPYAWPGSKDAVASNGVVQAPALPKGLKPASLLAPCPAGMMRTAPKAGDKNVSQPCIPIGKDGPAPAAAPASAPPALL